MQPFATFCDARVYSAVARPSRGRILITLFCARSCPLGGPTCITQSIPVSIHLRRHKKYLQPFPVTSLASLLWGLPSGVRKSKPVTNLENHEPRDWWWHTEKRPSENFSRGQSSRRNNCFRQSQGPVASATGALGFERSSSQPLLVN